jgi:hypothetical protein
MQHPSLFHFPIGTTCYSAVVHICGWCHLLSDRVGGASFWEFSSNSWIHQGMLPLDFDTLWLVQHSFLQLQSFFHIYICMLTFLYLTSTQRLDQLFDILNCRSVAGRGFKQPLRLSNSHVWLPFLSSTREYLLSLRTLDGALLSTKRYQLYVKERNSRSTTLIQVFGSVCFLSPDQV